MSLNRRKFLQSAGTLALGSTILSGRASNFLIKHPVGVQLFTFFNIIDDDVKGTLTKIATAGYSE